MAKKVLSEAEEAARVDKEQARNAEGGFFLKAAVYMLSRFPLTKDRYQNWTKGRRILVGWLLWLIVLPIIPIVAALVWYLNDPEGFKKSPWAKGLIALAVIWAGYAGLVITDVPQADINGKYSPIQTMPDGEKAVVNDTKESVASPDSKKKVENQTVSKSSGGKTFANCTEAFNAGVFDIKRSDASYQNKLDRDNDGIACEK